MGGKLVIRSVRGRWILLPSAVTGTPTLCRSQRVGVGAPHYRGAKIRGDLVAMKSPSQRACMAGAKLDDVTVSRPERLPTSPIQAECSVGVKRDTLSLWHRVEHGIDRLAQSGRCVV